MTEKLKVMCTGEILVDFHQLKDLQLTSSGKSLKTTSQDKIDKLAKSLQEYGIVNNLQVWKDGEDIYCFDAHHRKKALSKLEKDGLEIPLLPATRCLAKTIEEAKKLLFLKESSNSWVDTSVIQDYLSEIDFDIDKAKSLIEIPDFEWDQKESKKKDLDQEYTDENCKLAIVPDFFENHQCFIIVTHSEIDENFVREALNLTENRDSLSGDKKIRRSNVIDVEELRKVWAKK